MDNERRITQRIEVSALGHAALLAESFILYDKPLTELTYPEAVQTVHGAMIRSISTGYSVTQQAEANGRVIASTRLDGAEATREVLQRSAEQIARTDWDEGELLISIRKDRTLWDKIRRRPARVVPGYRFASSNH